MPTNKTVITVITSTLAGLAAICVGTVCFLSYKAIEIPPELNTLTAGLVGALTAMLVKTSPTEASKASLPSSDSPTEVKVMSTPKDPVHVEEGKESLVT